MDVYVTFVAYWDVYELGIWIENFEEWRKDELIVEDRNILENIGKIELLEIYNAGSDGVFSKLGIWIIENLKEV